MRFYHLNATLFIGDYATLEVHSNRPHPHLAALLNRRGVGVRDAMWHEFSPESPGIGQMRHGTGYADVLTRFHAVYEIQTCRYCPDADTDLCVMEVYRVIDDINAKWFP